MLGQMIVLFIFALLSLICLGWALWYLALWVLGYAAWDSVAWSMFAYQFGAVICALAVLGYWNYQSETRAKSIFLSLLGLLFLVNLNIAFEVPFVQRLQSCLPMLLNGAETQGQVVRVYMRETEKRDYLFHSQRTKQYLMPCAEYVFTTTEGRSYRGEVSCGRIDEMHVGQMIPVRYLPDNPQMNRSGRFFDMWGDTLLFGAASLGALCLTWYIFTRHFLGRKRRPNKRFRHLRRG